MAYSETLANRVREQLADVPAIVMHAAHRADGIAGLAVLDLAFAGALDPDRVIVEIADDFPDLRGRRAKDGAVIG